MKTLLFFRTSKLASWRRKLAGATQFAAAHGARVQTVERTDSPFPVRRLLDFWKPDGVIAEMSGGAPELVPSVFGRIPAVYIDRQPPNASSAAVSHDPKAIAELVARELLVGDPVSFAFVGWFEPVYWCELKQAAFHDILAANGRTARDFTPTRREQRDSVAFLRRLGKWLKALPKPCGLFAITDAIGAAVLAAAQAEGIAVPDELSVVSVDNDEQICESTHPTLSSVQPDFEASGRAAAEWLLAKRRRAGQWVTIAPLKLVRRGSSRRLAVKDREVDAALEKIRREATSGLSARDVFPLFACSRRLAEMRFRKATGKSVLEAIEAVRLERTFELLRDPTVPLASVPDFAGWKNPVSFRRYFLKTVGMTPGDWRASRPSPPRLP